MLLAVVDERRAAHAAPQPTPPPTAEQSVGRTETTQATQFAAALSAATARR